MSHRKTQVLQIVVNLPRRDVKEKLDAYCEDVGQTATMAIERILDDFLIKYIADKENASEGEDKADTAN